MRVTKTQIALVGLFLTIIGLIFTALTIQASVDYYLQNPPPNSFTVGLNSITIHSKNGGGQLDGDFILILTFVNASFSNETSKPYTIVDDSTVKFRYILHQSESAEKKVYFVIHENVKGFTIELSLEKTNFYDLLKANGLYPTKLQYIWNEQESLFILVE